MNKIFLYIFLSNLILTSLAEDNCKPTVQKICLYCSTKKYIEITKYYNFFIPKKVYCCFDREDGGISCS